LNARAPALAATKPTLLLPERALFGKPAAPGQDHALDAHFLSQLLIGAAPKAAVRRGQMRRLAKNVLVRFQGGLPLLLVGRIAYGNFVSADNAVFDLINADQAPKLIGLVRFAFANHYAVFLKKAQDFLRMMRLSLEDPGFGLDDDFFG